MPVPSLAGRKGRYRRTLSYTANRQRHATVGAIIFSGRQHEHMRRTDPTHGAAAEKELFERTDWICRSHLLQDERGDIEGHYHVRRMAEGTRQSVQ